MDVNVPAPADAAPVAEVPPVPAFVRAPGLVEAFDAYLALELDMPLDLRNALGREGIKSFEKLCKKENEDINTSVQSIRKPGGSIQVGRTLVADPGIHVASDHVDALKQLAYGLRHCVRTQVVFDPARHGVAWMTALWEFRTSTKKQTVVGAMPGKMTKTVKARESLNDVKRYLATIRGCNDAFLSYLIRDNEAPADPVEGEWPTIDHELIARVPLRGVNFQNDNRQLYTILDSVFGSGDGGAWIQRYAAAQDGRGAYLSLYNHYITRAARNKVVAEAEHVLDHLKYTSESRGVSFETYVSKHQQAYLDLTREGQVISEEERIKKLVRNIDSEVLAFNLRTIRNDQMRAHREYDTFDKAAQFLSLELLDERHASSARRGNVSGVQTGPSPGKVTGAGSPTGKGRGGKAKKAGATRAKSFLPKSQWRAMSADEREAFLAARRKTNGAANANGANEILYRSQIAALQATVQELTTQLKDRGGSSGAPDQLGTQMSRRNASNT
jgi:hypothetical protein